MTISLSTDQSNALDRIDDWYKDADAHLIHCNGGTSGYGFNGCPSTPHTHGAGNAPIYSLGGWAGSGKTTLMQSLEDQLGVRAVFGTPTHKAAAVLRKKLTGGQSARVRTYHSLVYHMHATHHCDVTGGKVRRVVDKCVCGQDDACECPAHFDPCTAGKTHDCRIREQLEPKRREYLGGHRSLVIIDESSMLSPEQVADVRSFGVPVLLVGDHGQLPPVKAQMNPFTMNPDVELTHNHRQGADSGIIEAAHDVRRNGHMGRARYGNGDAVRYPLSDPVMRGVFQRFDPGPERLIVTHTNRLRARLNQAGHGEGPPREGDRVVSLGGRSYEAVRVTPGEGGYRATRDFLTVHNGMTGTVLKVTDRGGPMIDIVVQLDDHVLATPNEPVCLLVAGVARAQFGAEKDLWKNSPDRPRGSRLWDYAYALTAYKAQGSEFDQVIVMDEGPPSYAQWLYTSITRAKQAVIVVNYHR
jgi:hypothetical protein